ncbi:hypothetical protein [Geminisphaera colitermitum]|uniref:hypothetical protein n=1 Tax=Geminisphaera colitermitum TaxID=1148786 RepID=UPI0001964DF7|nr:hypothetical protein [Geminisphaera colitermitum]
MQYFTNDQKAQVAMLAKRAYDAWEMREAHECINDHLSRTACFEQWRHQETGKVTGGITSLRRCVSELHFLPLIAHFNNLLGEGGMALRTLLRHAEAGRITVFYKLQQALAERGLSEGYAAAICRRQYKCDLGDAEEKQLWHLFFTIKNRRKAVAKPARKAPRYVRENLGTLTTTDDGNPF